MAEVKSNWFRFWARNELDESIVQNAIRIGFQEDENCPWRFFKLDNRDKQVGNFFLNEWQSKVQYTNHSEKIVDQDANKEDFLHWLQSAPDA